MNVHPDDPSPSKSGGYHQRMRLIVLGLVLAVGGLAAAFDYGVARPNVRQADQDIATRAGQSPPEIRSDEIRQIVGRQPSRIFQDQSNRVEVFSWVSGLPFRTHDLYVTFREVTTDEGESESLYRGHSTFAYSPPSAEF